MQTTFLEDYKNFRRNEINENYLNELKRLEEEKNHSLSKLDVLDLSFSQKPYHMFLYQSSRGLEVVKQHKKYVKDYLKGFLEDNLELIQFNDFKIYDHKYKTYFKFNKFTIFDLFETLLNDNTEYTIIVIEKNSYREEYFIEELNLSFKAFLF